MRKIKLSNDKTSEQKILELMDGAGLLIYVIIAFGQTQSKGI